MLTLTINVRSFPDNRQAQSRVRISEDDTVLALKLAIAEEHGLHGAQLKRMRLALNGIPSAALEADSVLVKHARIGRNDVVDVTFFDPVKCPATYSGHSDIALHVTISRDGRTLYTMSEDETVRVWDTSSARCMRTLKVSQGLFMAKQLALTPDEASLCYIRTQGATVWCTATWQSREVVFDAISAYCFAPCGSHLYGAQREASAVSIVDTSVWTARDVVLAKSSKTPLLAVAVSPCGERLYGGGEFKSIAMWCTRTWRCLAEVASSDWTLRLQISPDGGTLFSSPLWGGKVNLWAYNLARKGTMDCGAIREMTSGLASGSDTVVADVTPSPCGEFLYCVGLGVAVWEVSTRRFLGMVARSGGKGSGPSGTSLAVWYDCVWHNVAGKVRVCDSADLVDEKALKFDWANNRATPVKTNGNDGCGVDCIIA